MYSSLKLPNSVGLWLISIPWLLTFLSILMGFKLRSIEPLIYSLIAVALILIMGWSAESYYGNGSWALPILQVAGIVLLSALVVVTMIVRGLMIDRKQFNKKLIG